MAKVNWSAGIDSVSGALAKPGSNPQHSCEHMLLGTHRVAATTNPNCNRMYIRKKKKRSTPLTADEISVHARFRTVAAMIKERKASLEHISEDQANFLAQKDSPNGKRTMKAYYWKICGDIYDEQQG